MNHPAGDCLHNEQGPFRSEILRKVIVRLRPYDLPRAPSVNDTKEFTFYYILVTVFSIISMNILGTITIMSAYFTLNLWYEMKISSSYEIFYTTISLITVFLIKLFQCFVHFYGWEKTTKTTHQAKQRKKLRLINNFIYIPIILILWLGLSSTQIYQNRLNTFATKQFNIPIKTIDYVNHDSEFKWRQYDFKHPPFNTLMQYATDLKYQKAWNFVQGKLKCCGSYGIGDYEKLGISPPKICLKLLKLKQEEYGCLSIVNMILYEVSQKIHGFMLWLIIPLESILIFFTILAFITRCNRFDNCNQNGNSNNEDDAVSVYATYDVPINAPRN